MFIPLTHQNKRCYIGNQIQSAVIFPPPAAGEKITSTQFFLIDKGILQWCAKGIVIILYDDDVRLDSFAAREILSTFMCSFSVDFSADIHAAVYLFDCFRQVCCQSLHQPYKLLLREVFDLLLISRAVERTVFNPSLFESK